VNVLYLILPLALLIVFIAVGAFVWAARRGQFDDLETPAMRALHDDVGDQRAPRKAPPKAPPKD
jgi:cbb3-type cytochrome oxidase maturation protein